MEGGSCNAYDYVCGNPVNAFDLAGLSCGLLHLGDCAEVVTDAGSNLIGDTIAYANGDNSTDNILVRGAQALDPKVRPALTLLSGSICRAAGIVGVGDVGRGVVQARSNPRRGARTAGFSGASYFVQKLTYFGLKKFTTGALKTAGRVLGGPLVTPGATLVDIACKPSFG